ncbi:hypothetical protein [Nocardioides insulae]|uniref:hypothetical protein n=1 Tax=Nocardioides insulae TaxID=394734 RepID=UPI000427497C|nr:hypothetical protein [Nocardioides insulae]
MRITALFTVATALAVTLAGCADPSRRAEAESLRAELADLPGVVSVRLRYTEPVVLDSGKLFLHTTMAETATPEQIVRVTETAYDAFHSTHQHEEADLAVRAGRTTVALRAFEPEASVDAVGRSVLRGLTAAPDGGSAAIDLTTQRVPDGDHVAGTYVLSLPSGSTAAEVPVLLTTLAGQHDESELIGWGGAAADGSSLSYDSGFPPPELLARWERFQAAGPRLAVRAFVDGVLFAEGRLASAYDRGSRAERRGLERAVQRQLLVLGDGEWAYDLADADGGRLVSIDRYLCEHSSESPLDARLEAWVVERLGPCRPR